MISHKPIDIESIKATSIETMLKMGEVLPMVICEGSKQVHIVGLAGLGGTGNKHNDMWMAGRHVRKKRSELGELQQVAFVTEAWMVVTTPAKELAIRPSEHPDRIEILLIALLEIATNHLEIASLEIKRTGDHVDLIDRASKPDYVESKLIQQFVRGYNGLTPIR